jgi:hypothetical protein
MSGLEELRARLAECEVLLGELKSGVAAEILHLRANALRDAIAIVEPDYAAGEEAEQQAEEGDFLEADEAEETEAEADEEADLQDDDGEAEGVAINAAGVRAWCKQHGVQVTAGGFIAARQLEAINARRAEMDLLPFVLVGGR